MGIKIELDNSRRFEIPAGEMKQLVDTDMVKSTIAARRYSGMWYEGAINYLPRRRANANTD